MTRSKKMTGSLGRYTAAVLAVGLLASACASAGEDSNLDADLSTSSPVAEDSTSNSAAQSSVEDQPDAPRPDLVVAMGAIPNHLSPLQRTGSHMAVTTNLFDNILERDRTGTSDDGVVPGIAESWEYASPTELDLTIREGVQFHDGTALTVDDVVFSLARLMGDEPIERDELASTLETVVALDDRTVRITTSAPDPALLDRLASRIGRVLPESYFNEVGRDEFVNNPIGTGPYKLASFVGGDATTLEAFDDYWGGRPPAATVTFRDVPEVASRIAGLITGEVDIIDSVPLEQVAILDAEPDIEARSVLSDRVVLLEMMTTQAGKATSDNLIRQALVHAIDLDVIESQIWADTVLVPNGLNLPAHDDFYDESRQRLLPFDPERSAALLAEAGYEGEEIVWQWVAGSFPNFDSIAPVMVQMWTEVGLNVVIEPVADFTLLDYERASLFTGNNYVAVQDPIEPLWTYWGPTARSVTSGRCVQPDRFNELGATLDSAANFEERNSAFSEMLDLFDGNVCAFPLYVQPEIYGVQTDISWDPYSDFTMYFGPGNLQIDD